MPNVCSKPLRLLALEGPSLKLPVAVCPQCKSENDAAAAIGPDDARPKPGDVWLCLNCGLIALFGSDMLPRSLRADELAELPASAFRAAELISRGRSIPMKRKVHARYISSSDVTLCGRFGDVGTTTIRELVTCGCCKRALETLLSWPDE